LVTIGVMGEGVPGTAEDALKKWINGRGFPVETCCAREFARAGFSSVRGSRYEDPVSHKLREVDVLAFRASGSPSIQRETDVMLVFTIIAECKLVRQRSWVLFARPRLDQSGAPRFRFHANALGNRFLSTLEGNRFGMSSIAAVENESYDVREGPQTKPDVSDDSQDGLQQVLSAARARAGMYGTGTLGRVNIAEVIVPVVVLGGTMYECTPSMDDSAALRKVDLGLVTSTLWGAQSQDYSVIFATADGVSRLAVGLYVDAQTLFARSTELRSAAREARAAGRRDA
jgi:hypothetical protein